MHHLQRNLQATLESVNQLRRTPIALYSDASVAGDDPEPRGQRSSTSSTYESIRDRVTMYQDMAHDYKQFNSYTFPLTYWMSTYKLGPLWAQ